MPNATRRSLATFGRWQHGVVDWECRQRVSRPDSGRLKLGQGWAGLIFL